MIFLAAPLLASSAGDLLDRAAEKTDAGDYDAAVRDAMEAARLYGNDARGRAAAINQAGLAQLYAGLYPAARASFADALRAASSANDFEGVVEEHMNLASVDFFTGRYADAAAHYDAAARILAAHSGASWTRRRRHLLLANRAVLDQRLGRYEEALGAYHQALGDPSDFEPEEHAQMLANLGVLYRRMGDPYKALDAYDRARAIFARDQHADGELGVLKNRGIVLALDLRRLAEARATFAEALQRARAAGNAREALQAQLYGAETSLRLGERDAAARDFASALRAARELQTVEDQWKALYGLARCESLRGNDDAATRHLEDAVAVIERIRDAIRVTSLKSDFFNDKREVIDALIALRLRHGARADEVFDLVERGHSRGWRERLSLPPFVTLVKVQRALPEDALLLDYWTSAHGSAVVAVTRTSAIVYPIAVDAAEIRALANALARDGAWASHAKHLEALLPPIPASAKHLLIVTDGPLASIPFELLGDTIASHDVTYLPTAALLLRSPRAMRRFAPPWTAEFRGFGDPRFGSASLDPSLRGLPASTKEIRDIASELGGTSLLHLGPDDRKEHLASETNEPLLHIATHAFVDPGAIEQSRILFSADRPGGAATYLFLKEAYELPLGNVELAVLSACDTERGRVLPGEGIESFSRAFLAAGARSTVTTLWRVNDTTTASFMRLFYHHLQRGRPRAEALRLTKLRFREAGASPHAWAAFVLTGDGLTAVPTALRWRTILVALMLAISIAIALIRARRHVNSPRATSPRPHPRTWPPARTAKTQSPPATETARRWRPAIRSAAQRS